MSIKDLSTENRILEAARKLYLSKGKLGATTQDIADEAKVNRTLVNYYFRSIDNLLEAVSAEVEKSVKENLDIVLLSDKPFREKIEDLIDAFQKYVEDKPYAEVFLISEINNMSIKQKSKGHSGPSPELIAFLGEIQQAMEEGIARKMDPVNFLINIFSLISYPFIMKPLFIHLLDLSSPQYKELQAQRKSMLLQLLFI